MMLGVSAKFLSCGSVCEAAELASDFKGRAARRRGDEASPNYMPFIVTSREEPGTRSCRTESVSRESDAYLNLASPIT